MMYLRKSDSAPRFRTLVCVPLFAAILVVAGCGGDDNGNGGADEQSATDSRQVTLLTAAPAQVRLYPFNIAKERGYFEEEGLDVSIESVDGTDLVMQQIAVGRAQFGYGSSEGTIPAFAENPDTIRAFYDLFNTGIFHIYTLSDSEIEEPADLEGKTVGVDQLNTGEAIFARITAANAGLNPDEDLRLQPLTDQPAAQVSATQSGRVDAMAGPSDFKVAAEVQGIELKCVTCGETKVASSTLVVNKDFLDDNPELVAGFGRAVAKATIFGQENSDAVLEIMRDAAPEDFTDPRYPEAILEQSLADLEATEEGKYGAIDRQAWETQVRFLSNPAAKAGEVFLREPVDLDQLLVTDLVDEINDFDAGEAREEARGGQ